MSEKLKHPENKTSRTSAYQEVVDATLLEVTRSSAQENLCQSIQGSTQGGKSSNSSASGREHRL
eukprot:861822-Prorocentrum_lima.AAC.1